MHWMILFALFGVITGYIYAKIDNLYILIPISWGLLAYFNVFGKFGALYQVYTYWILVPLAVHLMLFVLVIWLLRYKAIN